MGRDFLKHVPRQQHITGHARRHAAHQHAAGTTSPRARPLGVGRVAARVVAPVGARAGGRALEVLGRRRGAGADAVVVTGCRVIVLIVRTRRPGGPARKRGPGGCRKGRRGGGDVATTCHGQPGQRARPRHGACFVAPRGGRARLFGGRLGERGRRGARRRLLVGGGRVGFRSRLSRTVKKTVAVW